MIFIALHRLYLQGVLNVHFSIDNEQGWSEQYQHAKELIAAVAAGGLLLTRGEVVYACWIGLFGYMFLDDTLEFHEHVGTLVSNLPTGSMMGMPGQAFGEMVASLTAGGAFLLWLAWAWRRSTADAKQLSCRLLTGLAALAAVGIGVDAVHSLVRVDPWRYRLGIIEEGGELLLMSAITWLVVTAFVRTGTAARTRLGKRWPAPPHWRIPS